MTSPIRIRYIDGRRLRRCTLAAARWLIGQQQSLNDINVFPVPDGDTGTNMAFTMRGVFDRLSSLRSHTVSEISEGIADAALLGARGNSGAILAQFFQGLAHELQGKLHTSTEEFAHAVAQGSAWAREAVSEPKEGTILTVIQDWAMYILHHAPTKKDFLELFEHGVEQARESLRRTPEQLAELKKAGVVDAGAQGFVYLLEGALEYMKNGRIDRELEIAEQDNLPAEAHIEHDAHDLTFRYCTECMVHGEHLETTHMRQLLTGMGDSLVIAGSSRKMRIHIHTDTPIRVFEALEAIATVSHQKADDMYVQARDAFGHETAALALVVDSACDLPPELMEQYNIHVVPVRLSFGDKEYIDRVTIDEETFFRKLKTDPHHPRTSQPSPADFDRVYAHVMSHYEAAISLHIPEMYSGTIQSARRAGHRFGDRIDIVDAEAVSIATGLLALNTVRRIRRGMSRKEVLNALKADIKRLEVYVALPTVEFLIKGGRVSYFKGLMGRFLNIRPVINFGEKGKIEAVGKAIGTQDVYLQLLKIIEKRVGTQKGLMMSVGHAAAPEKCSEVIELLRRQYEPTECFSVPLSPALSIHGGPGLIGIAFLPPA
ncbi:MAG: DegV family EDD domain-containing protein [Bacteroidetes Order II. Incertae sedis bacterium]|nr:DegV family EDD domain-containing protein [Bacteroidetes Order II. bacterium]